MKIFVSYSRNDDEPFVHRLVDYLAAGGVDVWFDRRNMPSRSLAFMDEIRRTIDTADRLLVVVGPQAVASEYVRSEWHYALSRGKAVTPVLRVGQHSMLPAELGKVHCPDARPDRLEAEALAEVLRVLSEPVLPLGELAGLPPFPPHFRPRPDEMSTVVAGLLADEASTMLAEDWRRVIVIAGMGGAGKSVLAAASARATSVRRVFTDGVLWVDAREHPQADALAERVLRLAQDSDGAGGGPPIEERLRRGLTGRHCLVILDNADDLDQVAILAQALDATGRLLVTSRDAGLVDDAEVVPLGGLSPSAARELLVDWMGGDAAPGPVDELVRRSEGLPFALSLCGAMAAYGVPVPTIAERVAAADVGFLERRFPGYPYPSLLPMLDASLDVLRARSPQAADLFPSFAVFRAGARVPVSVIERFWGRRADVTPAYASKHLALMRGLSLVRSDDDQVELHQLVHDYAAALVNDGAALHRDLLDAYGVGPEIDLADGPDDGYYHANLIHHLLRAARTDLAVSTLTTSASWLHAKQDRPRLRGTFAADADLVLAALERTDGSSSGGPPDPDATLDALVRLRTARHVAQHGPSAWSPSILRAMVAVGDDADALASVRATADPSLRINQLLELAGELRRAGRSVAEIVDEARAARDAEPDPARRGHLDVTLATYLAVHGEPLEALAAWRACRDRAGAASLALVLTSKLLRVDALEEARQVAAESPVAHTLVEVDAAVRTGNDDAVRGALRLVPPGVEGTMARNSALMRLAEVGRDDLVSELRKTLPDDERIYTMPPVAESSAIAEELAAARRLPAGLHRASGLLSIADGLERLHPTDAAPPAPEPENRAHPGHSRDDRGLRRWFRRRSAGHDPRAAEPSMPRARTAGPDPAELVRESLRDAEYGPVSERPFIFEMHADRAFRRDDAEAADMLVRAWRQSLDDLPEPRKHSEGLARLATSLAHAGKVAAARGALADADAAAAEATTNADRALAAVLPAYAVRGHFDATLERALAIGDDDSRRRALEAIAGACADQALSDKTAVLVARASSKADGAALAAAHARALALRGRVPTALETVDGLDENDRERALSQIVAALIDADRIEAAADVAERFPDRRGYWRVAACCAIARALADRAGPQDRADGEAWLVRAAESMTPPPGLDFALARTECARAAVSVRPEAAGDAFRAALDAATRVREPTISLGGIVGQQHRSRALEVVAQALADHGFVDDSAAVATTFDDEGPEWEAVRARILGCAAVAARRAGGDADRLFAEARRHASAATQSVVGTNWRFVAWVSLAHHLCEAGEWSAGLEAIERVDPSLDVFLAVIAQCCHPRFRRFTLEHLTATLDIVGWVRPDWRQLAATMHGEVRVARPLGLTDRA